METITQTTQTTQITLSEQEQFLVINKQNGFGDKQYVLSEELSSHDTISVGSIEKGKFWSIKNPNSSLMKALDQHHPGWTMYECSGGLFALSPKAATVIKPEGFGQGAVARICFMDSFGKKRFLFVADNKIYIQSVQGGVELNEQPEEACKREAMEEVRIDLSKKHLVPIARYSYLGGNELIDCKWDCSAHVFAVYLSWDEVKHLFPNGVSDNEFSVTLITDLAEEYSEIEQIFSVPCDKITSFPENFELYPKKTVQNGQEKFIPLEFQKIGHHRQLLEKLSTDEEFIKPRFLTEFVCLKREQEALCEWNQLNPEHQF